jgi:hypothetical protein
MSWVDGRVTFASVYEPDSASNQRSASLALISTSGPNERPSTAFALN